MAKLRNCPFCNREMNDNYPDISYNDLAKKWFLTHWCDLESPTGHTSVLITGETKQEVIDRWNGEHHES